LPVDPLCSERRLTAHQRYARDDGRNSHEVVDAMTGL
jgi:hypothetical protein